VSKLPGKTASGRFGKRDWLNRAVLGIGWASLYSNWLHAIATAVSPFFLTTMGVAALWMGLIEGVSAGLFSFAHFARGYYH